jgi:hypothetical protein
MKRVVTTVRCVPRCGFANTEVRTVDLDLTEDPDGDDVKTALEVWFAQRGIDEAVYDVHTDDHGFFAVVNDETYDRDWGTAML